MQFLQLLINHHVFYLFLSRRFRRSWRLRGGSRPRRWAERRYPCFRSRQVPLLRRRRLLCVRGLRHLHRRGCGREADDTTALRPRLLRRMHKGVVWEKLHLPPVQDAFHRWLVNFVRCFFFLLRVYKLRFVFVGNKCYK